jgi:hydrogenase nickel incorporation protein HypA/HybF
VHELSIAASIADQVGRHAPALGRVRAVEIRVGALRGLETTSLELCWQAVTHGSALAGSQLVVDQLPWSLACPTCGRTWSSAVPFVSCSCGEPAPHPTGSDELDLVALSVEDADEEDEAS